MCAISFFLETWDWYYSILFQIIGAAEDVDENKMDQKKKKEGDNDEFDMFAQSRKATYETTKNRYYILFCIIKISLFLY